MSTYQADAGGVIIRLFIGLRHTTGNMDRDKLQIGSAHGAAWGYWLAMRWFVIVRPYFVGSMAFWPERPGHTRADAAMRTRPERPTGTHYASCVGRGGGRKVMQTIRPRSRAGSLPSR